MELNPRAPLLDIDTFVELLLRETAAETLPAPNTSAPIPHVHHHVAVHLQPPVMSEEGLRRWLQALPRDILRVKGLVRISDREMCYFNRTDDPFEAARIIKVRTQEGMEPAVVFIGPGLNEKSLLASFTAPSAKPPAFKLG